jgi:hypothetical protein
MPLTLVLPDNYSYVLLAASSSLFLTTVHFFVDAQARKKSGLKYPVSYATPEQIAKNPAAYQFNCGTSPKCSLGVRASDAGASALLPTSHAGCLVDADNLLREQ